MTSLQKFILAFVLLLILVAVGGVVYQRYYSIRVKRVLIDQNLLPESNISKVTLETENSARGRYSLVTDTEIQQTTVSREGAVQTINWEITDTTVFSCMQDLMTTPNGQTYRQSEIHISFEGGTKTPGINKGMDWFKANAKKDSPVWIFGDRATKKSTEVVLFMDKCQ